MPADGSLLAPSEAPADGLVRVGKVMGEESMDGTRSCRVQVSSDNHPQRAGYDVSIEAPHNLLLATQDTPNLRPNRSRSVDLRQDVERWQVHVVEDDVAAVHVDEQGLPLPSVSARIGECSVVSGCGSRRPFRGPAGRGGGRGMDASPSPRGPARRGYPAYLLECDDVSGAIAQDGCEGIGGVAERPRVEGVDGKRGL